MGACKRQLRLESKEERSRLGRRRAATASWFQTTEGLTFLFTRLRSPRGRQRSRLEKLWSLICKWTRRRASISHSLVTAPPVEEEQLEAVLAPQRAQKQFSGLSPITQRKVSMQNLLRRLRVSCDDAVSQA